MSDGLTFNISGHEDLLKEVRKMDDRAQKRIVLKTLRAIGRVMVKEAKTRVPVGDLSDGFHQRGNLRRSIGVKALTRLGDGNIAVLVGPRVGGGRLGSGYHGIMVEKGTKPHTVNMKKRGFKYTHKGSKAQKYLEVAFKAAEKQAEAELIKVMEKILYG